MQRKETCHAIVQLHGSDDDVGVQTIRRLDRAKGKLDIGYHYVIRRNGTIEVGRDSLECGNHTPGRNHDSLGICIVAARWDSVTAEQHAALLKLRSRLEKLFPGITVIPHQ